MWDSVDHALEVATVSAAMPHIIVVLWGILLEVLPCSADGPSLTQPSPCSWADAQHHLWADETPRRPSCVSASRPKGT